MIKNIGMLLISNILFGFSQMLIIIFLNKFGGLDDVGSYTLALSIVGPLTVFFNFSLNLHYNSSKVKPSKKDYLILRIVCNIFMIFSSLIVSYCLGYDYSHILTIFMIANLKYIESIFDINYAFFQREEKHDKIANSKLIRSAMLILWLFFYCLLFNMNLVILVLGMLIINITLLSFDLKKINFKYKKNCLNVRTLKVILLTSAPLGISSTIDSLNINIQRIIVERVLSLEELGIYASISTFMITGQLVISSIMTYYLPKLNNAIMKKDKYNFLKILFSTSLMSITIGFVAIIVMLLSGEYLLTLLFNNNYAQYKILGTIIMVVGLFWYLSGTLSYAIISLNLYNTQLLVIFISFITMCLTTPYFVTIFGITGAAISLLLSMSLRALLFLIAIKIKLKEVFE